MVRYLPALAIALLAGTQVRAGELDNEFKGKPAATPPSVQKCMHVATNATQVSRSQETGLAAQRNVGMASELDREVPTQAWRRRWGGCGFGRVWGCGYRCGWGRCGLRLACGFWNCCRPCISRCFTPYAYLRCVSPVYYYPAPAISYGSCGYPAWDYYW
jgi:hypothetical protein